MKKYIKKKGQTDGKFGQILGINVISSSTSGVLAGVKEFVSYNHKFYIVTPNPELVLMAQKNADLRNSLNAADLPLPDGVGLNYASKFLYGKPLNIIPGRKLFLELIKLAGQKGWKVFLLGGMDSEAELAAKKLKVKNSKLKIETLKGPVVGKDAEPVGETNVRLQKEAIEKINKFAPQLLFVAMTNPKQEIWIHKNLAKLNIGGAMAVGGTFRYISGLSKLPPSWMEKAGLEWVWRLISEPKRLGRMWNAVLVFPLKVFLYKLSSKL